MVEDTPDVQPSELFEHIATSAHLWFTEAAGLMRAAYVLWDRYQRKRDEEQRRAPGEVDDHVLVDISTDRFVSSYMLLGGFAIENVVKGLIISRQTAPLELRRLPREVRSHDLRKLFGTAEIELDMKEELLLEALHEAIVWKGRYHSPIHLGWIDGTYPWADYGKRFYPPDDIRNLFNRVVETYPQDVWDAVRELPGPFPGSSEQWLRYVNEECPARPR